MKNLTFMVLSTLCCFISLSAETNISDSDAKLIVKKFGHNQGYCLILGQGKSALPLAKNSSFYIHELTSEGKNVQAERLSLSKANLAERACVVLREGKLLPYADNLINLIIVTNNPTDKNSMDEIIRVCTPKGKIFAETTDTNSIKALTSKKLSFKKVGRWTMFEKPSNPGFGDWTHIKAGPGLSYVSKDTEVAPWKEIRWIGGPLWGSLYSSYSGLVSGGGIVYYKEASSVPKTKLNLHGKEWYLIARDAYNGFEYWRISMAAFEKYYRNPDYTMCCDSKRIYLRQGKGFIARNGLTGKITKKYKIGFVATYATLIKNTLIISNKVQSVGVDKISGKILWNRKSLCHPASMGKSSFIYTKDSIESVQYKTGKSLWKKSFTAPVGMIVSMLAKDDNVYVNFKKKWKSDRILVSFNAKTGAQAWSKNNNWGEGAQYGTIPFKDSVWIMTRSNKKRTETVGVKVVNTKTGKIDKDFRIPGGVMGKCWGVRSTPNYFLYSNGWFYDRKKNKGYSNNSTRSPCRLGQHPANGLTYFMPHHCDCQVSLRGFLALSKKGQVDWIARAKGSKQLVKGNASHTKLTDKKTDWSMFKKNGFRNNFVAQTIKGDLKKKWSVKLGDTALTQATIAYGMIFVGQIKSHQVFALDEKTGKKKWNFVADGAVTIPPSLADGYCLVSTSSGTLHCLNAKDGKELWRFRAAPAQKFIGVKGKLDSPWPIQGGVFIHKGNAYFTVGRATSQSLGFYLYGVNIATGKVLWTKNIKGKRTCSGDMFLSDGNKLSLLGNGYDFQTGKLTMRLKQPLSMIRSTVYLTRVSIVDYIQNIKPQHTDKRHVYLSDGRLKGDLISSNVETSIASGQYSTGYPGWKKKHGQFFIQAKGKANWLLDNLSHQIYGLVSTNDKIFTVGLPGNQDLKKKSELWVFNTLDGKKLQTIVLDNHPVYDSISVANNKVFYSTRDGHIICFGN